MLIRHLVSLAVGKSVLLMANKWVTNFCNLSLNLIYHTSHTGVFPPPKLVKDLNQFMRPALELNVVSQKFEPVIHKKSKKAPDDIRGSQ